MPQTIDAAAEETTIMYAPNGFVLRLTGEVGQTDAEQLRDQLTWVAALSPRRLVLDLSAVTVMDPFAFEVLAELRGSMVKHGGEVRLAGMNPQVRADLKASKLERLFRIYQSMKAALCW